MIGRALIAVKMGFATACETDRKAVLEMFLARFESTAFNYDSARWYAHL
jgi:hypothetical protein